MTDTEKLRHAIAECERNIEGTKDALKSALLSIADLNDIRAKLEAQLAAMRRVLENLVAWINSPPTNEHSIADYKKAALAALSSDAGQALLAVAEAAEEVRTNGEWTDGDWKISPEVYATLSDALAAWRKP